MHLLLYDGVCGLCNRLVRFVLDRDRKGEFRFASLQSAMSKELLRKYGRDPDDLDTFYAILDKGLPTERILRKGRAGIFVLRRLGGIWSPAVLATPLPDFLLDLVYDNIASRRYRWFGKLDTCPMPRPGDAAKFLASKSPGIYTMRDLLG